MRVPRFRDYLEAWEALGPEDQGKALSYMQWLADKEPRIDPYDASPDSGTHPTRSVRVPDTMFDKPYTSPRQTSRVDRGTIDKLLAAAEVLGATPRQANPSDSSGCRDCGSAIVGNYCVGCGRPVHWEKA